MLLITLAFLLLGTASTPTPAPTVGARVTTSAFDGVIVVAHDSEEWTPTEAQIGELEKALPAYVASRQKDRGSPSRRLSEYKRQYLGWVHEGHRIIIVHFFHQSTELVSSGKWLRAVFTVDGGGDDYLEARYDASSRAFTDFQINGPL